MTEAATRPATRSLRSRLLRGQVFALLCFVSALVGLLLLGLLLFDVVAEGGSKVTPGFLDSYPSRFPDRAGVKSALWGTLWVMGITALFCVPVGVAAAIYLEEYARPTRLNRFIQTNIYNLAGVPAIIYGILGLALFVRGLQLERSVLSGGLTLGLMSLPVVIISTQEALRSIPFSIREAAYGVGSTRWQMVRHHLLPASLPGILTGSILALSRAIGEAAPLIVIGALTFIAFTPASPFDPFTTLPVQIFNWASRPQAEFQAVAAGGIIVLLGVLLAMNAAAILVRNRYQRRLPW